MYGSSLNPGCVCLRDLACDGNRAVGDAVKAGLAPALLAAESGAGKDVAAFFATENASGSKGRLFRVRRGTSPSSRGPPPKTLQRAASTFSVVNPVLKETGAGGGATPPKKPLLHLPQPARRSIPGPAPAPPAVVNVEE